MEDSSKQGTEQENGGAAILPIVLTADPGSMETVIKNAEKQVEFVKRIKNIALSVTNERDWSDQDGQPYLESMGCMKVRGLFGVDLFDQKRTMDKMDDEKGKYVLVTITGKARFGGKVVEDIGTCSTRDSFFGKAKGVAKALEDVDMENIIKKAVTNLQNRLLKKALGLGFTWEDLSSAKLNVDKIKAERSVQRGAGRTMPQATDQEKQRQEEIRKWVLEMSGGDTAVAGNALEEMTRFPGSKGETVPGVKSVTQLTATRLNINHSKIKAVYDAWVKSQQ